VHPAVAYGGQPQSPCTDRCTAKETCDCRQPRRRAWRAAGRRFRERPLPKERALMPTFPSAADGARHHKRAHHRPSPDPRPADAAQLLRARAAEVAAVFGRKDAAR